MRFRFAWIFVVAAIAVVSCKKHTSTPPETPPPVKKVLLKDLTEAHLPDPYYHFEYGADSQVVKVSFDSGLTMYDVFYNGKNISEMRNNILVNHDTLRYIYDNTGKVGLILFKHQTGVTYGHVFFTYSGQQVIQMEWDHGVGNVGFIIDRTLTFTYFPDGNVKEITEHRPVTEVQSTEATYTTHYDQYDDKINVEEFTLWHNGINDQLFLLPGIHIQKNNPRKEIRTGDGINYTVDYSYTYTNDNAPITKTGDVLFTQGPEAGQRFQTRSDYTYY